MNSVSLTGTQLRSPPAFPLHSLPVRSCPFPSFPFRSIVRIVPRADRGRNRLCAYFPHKTAPEEPLGNLFAQKGDRREVTLNNFALADVERREINVGAIYPGSVSGTVYYDDDFSSTPDAAEKKVSDTAREVINQAYDVFGRENTSIED